MQGLTIGKIAKRAGVSNDTVRFYERCGLLRPGARSAAKYRLYTPADGQRLCFIKRAKELGFSLREIKDLLALSEDPKATKADIRERTEKKAERIRQNIRDLTRILTALEQLNTLCDGEGAARECPILKSLTDNEEPDHAEHTSSGPR